MNKTEWLLVIILLVILLGIGANWFGLAANVQVRVFQSIATGGLVYCRTGSLPASSHEDLGTASVSVSQAVDCP